MCLSQQRAVGSVVPARYPCRGLHPGCSARGRSPCAHAGRRRGPARPWRGRGSPLRGRGLSMNVPLSDLLRPDLRGQTPYGAPQLDVAVALNTNENSYAVPGDVVDAIVSAVAEVV